MTLGGAIGGPFAGWLYRDFFNPPNNFLWHMGFGGFFLGTIAAIALFVTDRRGLVAEEAPRVSRDEKAQWSAVVFIIASILIYIGVNAVVATALVLMAGAFGITKRRPDLAELVVVGATTSVVFFGTVTLCFLFVVSQCFLVVTPPILVVGQALSPFYLKYGPWWTTVALVLWAPAFGGVFTALHAFFRNKTLDSV
jgi:hypothetical protein